MRFMQAVLAAIFGVVLAGLANFGALADFNACVSNTHCDAFTVCQPNQAWFAGQFGIPAKVCRRLVCNDDNHCPRGRPLCLQGFCQAREESRPVGGQPATPLPPPSGLPGDGKACGRIKIGQVTKNVGCLAPFVCVKGNKPSGTCRLAI
jgi:hypothetical protein